MPHEGVEIPTEEIFEGHDFLDKAIVVAIVVTAFLAAITALGQMRALKRHDEAISRADQWAALAGETSYRIDSMSQAQLERSYAVQDARVRGEQSYADAFLGVSPPGGDSFATGDRWATVARDMQIASRQLATGGPSPLAVNGETGEFQEIQQLTQPSVPDLSVINAATTADSCPTAKPSWTVQALPGPVPTGGPDSPTSDPNFPTRYLADHRRGVFLLEARATLASEHAQAEEKQFTRFGLSLTLFATAVFLFGFSLSPYGKIHRRLYATGAALLVIGSCGWAVYAQVDTPSGENTRAAAAYADGQVASMRGQDQLDTKQAIAFYGCAIKFDPGFAPAYTGRAVAYNSVFDPNDPTGGSNTELVLGQDAKKAISDLSAAKDNGAADALLPAIKGTDVFESGIKPAHGFDNAKLEQGLQLEQQAANLLSGSSSERALTSRSSGTQADGGLAADKAMSARLLALSTEIAFNIGEAELALGHHKLAKQAYKTAVSLANQQITVSGIGQQGFASGAVTDLTEIHDRATSKSQQGIRDQAQTLKEYVVDQLFSQSQARVRPTAMISRILVFPGLAGFRVAGDVASSRDINAQWYYRPSHSSRPWSAFGTGLSGTPGARDATGYYTTAFIPSNVCLPSGDYRLELYVHGWLVDAVHDSVNFPALTPMTLQDINVTICKPDRWREVPNAAPRQSPPVRVQGLADGAVSPDGRAGMLVFDVTPEADQQRFGDHLGSLMDKALRQFGSFFPAIPIDGQPFKFPFLGQSTSSLARIYAYPGGLAAAGIGATSTGRVILAIVYGPDKWFLRRAASGFPTGAELLGSVVSTDLAPPPTAN